MIELATCNLSVTVHVLERWSERVNAGILGPDAAMPALENFCRSGELAEEPPVWAQPVDQDRVLFVTNPAVEGLVVVARPFGDGLALITVLSRVRLAQRETVGRQRPSRGSPSRRSLRTRRISFMQRKQAKEA